MYPQGLNSTLNGTLKMIFLRFWFISSFLILWGVMPAYYIPEAAAINTRLGPSAGYAIVGPYDVAASGAANFGGAAGNTSKEYFVHAHNYRIRQSGSIRRIKLYAANTTNLTAVYFKVWRKGGAAGTYDLAGTSNNILSSLTAGQINTIDLSTAIDAQEGDFYGFRLEWTDGTQNLYAKSGVASLTTYSVTNTTPAVTGFAWESQTASAGVVVPIEMYMAPPVFVAVGDSLVSGNPNHRSYLLVDTSIDATHKQVARFIALKLNYTYQNMGVGGENVGTRAARFNADVVALHPRFAVIEGGTADIINGASKAQYVDGWVTMLDLAIANGITPVAVLIPPCTYLTTAQHQTREDWNNSLTNLVMREYPAAVLVDTETYLGKYKTGGDAGNLWDLQTAYNADNTHLTVEGNRRFAQAIVDAINLYYQASPR